jgi:hypothetical protein
MFIISYYFIYFSHCLKRFKFNILLIFAFILRHFGSKYYLEHSICYNDLHDTNHDILTLCVTDDQNPSGSDSSTSNTSSSSSDDPVSASKVEESEDSALNIDKELSHIPGDVNDLASKSKALNNSSSSNSDSNSDESIHIIDTSLINFITTMYDDARICVENYDLLSTRFSKSLDISPSFDHLSDKSKGLFLNSVSTSIKYSWSG